MLSVKIGKESTFKKVEEKYSPTVGQYLPLQKQF